MTVAVMTWAFKQDVRPTQKMVLLVLADHANDNGECWPSIATIARKASMSATSVKRNLADLEKTGLIRRERRKRSDGSWTSSRYFLACGPLGSK